MAFKLECSTCGEKLCQFCGSCHQINELDIHCPEYVPECSEAKVMRKIPDCINSNDVIGSNYDNG